MLHDRQCLSEQAMQLVLLSCVLNGQLQFGP
jgi:hypothetical protein